MDRPAVRKLLGFLLIFVIAVGGGAVGAGIVLYATGGLGAAKPTTLIEVTSPAASFWQHPTPSPQSGAKSPAAATGLPTIDTASLPPTSASAIPMADTATSAPKATHSSVGSTAAPIAVQDEARGGEPTHAAPTASEVRSPTSIAAIDLAVSPTAFAPKDSGTYSGPFSEDVERILVKFGDPHVDNPDFPTYSIGMAEGIGRFIDNLSRGQVALTDYPTCAVTCKSGFSTSSETLLFEPVPMSPQLDLAIWEVVRRVSEATGPNWWSAVNPIESARIPGARRNQALQILDLVASIFSRVFHKDRPENLLYAWEAHNGSVAVYDSALGIVELPVAEAARVLGQRVFPAELQLVLLMRTGEPNAIINLPPNAIDLEAFLRHENMLNTPPGNYRSAFVEIVRFDERFNASSDYSKETQGIPLPLCLTMVPGIFAPPATSSIQELTAIPIVTFDGLVEERANAVASFVNRMEEYYADAFAGIAAMRGPIEDFDQQLCTEGRQYAPGAVMTTIVLQMNGYRAALVETEEEVNPGRSFWSNSSRFDRVGTPKALDWALYNPETSRYEAPFYGRIFLGTISDTTFTDLHNNVYVMGPMFVAVKQ